jgi:hypothetical protein
MPTLLSLVLWLTTALAGATAPKAAPQPVKESGEAPAIRDFDLATLESLGRQIYEQDFVAARGTDALFASGFTAEEGEREGIRGWIVVRDGSGWLVRFVKEVDGALAPARDIAFDTPRSRGIVTTPGTTILPEDQAARYRASRLVDANIPVRCAERYNTVVLSDPDGSGFLVYALAAESKRGEVVLGGHARLTVSADGRTVERVDALSKACLVLNETNGKQASAARGKLAGLAVGHLVSLTPVETHVFVSLLHHLPLYVGTRDGTTWKVEGGRITRTEGATTR